MERIVWEIVMLKPDTVSDAGFAALGKLLDNMMLQFLCL